LFHQYRRPATDTAATTLLAFGKLQASGLPAVTQPFQQNNAPLVIEKPFLEGCLLLSSVRVG
jgi:hypothetical protein